MDWSTREATEQLRVEREAAIAREESVRKARLKDVCGMELFGQLRTWMAEQAQSYNEQIRKQALKVAATLSIWCPHSDYFFRVSYSISGTRLPMESVLTTPRAM